MSTIGRASYQPKLTSSTSLCGIIHADIRRMSWVSDNPVIEAFLSSVFCPVLVVLVQFCSMWVSIAEWFLSFKLTCIFSLGMKRSSISSYRVPFIINDRVIIKRVCWICMTYQNFTGLRNMTIVHEGLAYTVKYRTRGLYMYNHVCHEC